LLSLRPSRSIEHKPSLESSIGGTAA
jgi:hypothetical protein